MLLWLYLVCGKHSASPLFNSQREGIQTDKRDECLPACVRVFVCASVSVLACVYCQQINQCLFAK